jgi:predicted porin
MQKKIIALAIAAAMAAPAAAIAAPTVYGQVNMAYEMTDNGGTGGVGVTGAKRNQVSSNVSRLGFKGSEDLGDGMTAVWQMEGEVKTDTGAQAFFTRNTYMGVAGGFGTVVLGRHDTPYKLATRGMDVFADTIADNRSTMGATATMRAATGITHDTRLSDVVAYLTPNFDGFSGAVAMVGKTDNTLPAAGTTNSGTSLLANYSAGPLSISLGHQNVSETTLGQNVADLTATKLSGSYTMDALTVGLVYEMLTDKFGTSKTDQSNIHFAGKYAISDADTVKLAITMAGESKTDGATDTGSGATQISVGYDHSLTKNTKVFALYTAISNDTAATYGFTSGGSTGDTGSVGADNDPSAIAVGLRHSF